MLPPSMQRLLVGLAFVGLIISASVGPGWVGASPLSATVEGVISQDTIWTLADSPITLSGPVLVGGDATLTVEAGVEVRFDAGQTLQVNGTLIARGTATDPVVFTSSAASPAAGDWGHILFANSSQDATFDAGGSYQAGSILEHCTVKYGGGASGSAYAVRIDQSAPFINSCTISDNAGSGIRVTDIGSANLKVTNSTISGNTASLPSGGVSIYSNSSPSITLSGNTITNNTTSGVGGGCLHARVGQQHHAGQQHRYRQ